MLVIFGLNDHSRGLVEDQQGKTGEKGFLKDAL